jgi:hypothetical protein
LSNGKFEPGFESKGLFRRRNGWFCAAWRQTSGTGVFPAEFLNTRPFLPYHVTEIPLRARRAASRWQRQRHNPQQHAAKQPPRQMTLRQEQPLVARTFNQTASDG